MGGINHQLVRRSPFTGKRREDAVEDAQAAPAHEAVIQGLVRTVVLRCVAPTKAVLDAVVGQHDTDVIGDGLHQGVEKGRGGNGVGAGQELNEGELRGPVEADEEVELASGGANFGNINVEEADRIAPELLLRWLVALDLRQAADAVAL